jgi:glycosyltransferase involved in cell wall biosynthesis
MKKPELISITIGIPTYNGEATILDTLRSLINQKVDEQFNFEILISNNNSTDNVVEVSENFLRSMNFNDYRIIVNNRFSNSFDGNILNLYYSFSTDYIWFLSDDDTLDSSTSLNKVLRNIQINRPDLITFNYHECNSEMKINDIRYRNEEIVETLSSNGNEWLFNSRLYFGLISTCVIKRDLVTINEIMPFYNYNSIHIPLLMIAASRGVSSCTNQYLLKHRTGNARWGENGTAILPMTQISDMLISLGQNYSYDSKVIRHYIGNFFNANWKLLLKAKAYSSLNLEVIFFTQLRVYRKFMRFWIIDFFIFLLPNRLIKKLLSFSKLLT